MSVCVTIINNSAGLTVEHLLFNKVAQNPYVISIGDRIYYLKDDKDLKFYAGVGYITEIFRRGTKEIMTLEGSMLVDDVYGIMVAVVAASGDTFKLYLKTGQFTYSYKNLIETIFNSKRRNPDDD